MTEEHVKYRVDASRKPENRLGYSEYRAIDDLDIGDARPFDADEWERTPGIDPDPPADYGVNRFAPLDCMARETFAVLAEHGLWGRETSPPQAFCQLHSEVSEAYEAWRRYDVSEMRQELADVLITLLNISAGMGFSIADEVKAMHEKNKARPYRHGGKRC